MNIIPKGIFTSTLMKLISAWVILTSRRRDYKIARQNGASFRPRRTSLFPKPLFSWQYAHLGLWTSLFLAHTDIKVGDYKNSRQIGARLQTHMNITVRLAILASTQGWFAQRSVCEAVGLRNTVGLRNGWFTKRLVHTMLDD